MIFGLVLDEIYLEHETPAGHPERAERVRNLMRNLKNLRSDSRIRDISPRLAEREWLLCVHSQEHLRRVEATQGNDCFAFDPDTFAGPESFRVASMAAGGAIALVEELFKGEIESGILLARPPGHHAERDRAMGFCLFNNAAVASEWALRTQRAKRLAIIDFDVHHGNGTQQTFYQRPDVLYISTHQYPFYPGTGAVNECGDEKGEGFNLNFPLRAGTGDAFVTAIYEEFIIPVLLQYRPDLIIVSAGYDIHYQDPLGGLQLTEDGIVRLIFLLNQTAREVCEGRLVYLLEGGYHLQALSDCVQRTIEVTLDEEEVLPVGQPPSDYSTYRQEIRNVMGKHWTL